PLEDMFEILGSEKELAPILSGFPGKPAAGQDPAARQALLRDLYGRVMTMPQFEVDGILDSLVSRLQAEEAAGQLARDNPGFWALRAARTFPLPAGHRDRGILSF